MSIFTTSMKAKWDNRIFVDLMAGPGRNIMERGDEEFDGSPLLALKTDPPFTEVILVESEPSLLHALTARTTSFDRTIFPGDCNDPAVIAAIRARLTQSWSTLGLAFVDMLGLDVSLRTLEQLTAGQVRLDLAITFQVSDLTRNVPLVMQGRTPGDRLDAFFGDDGEWRQVVASSPLGTAGQALTDYYCDRLGTIGYGHVAQLHVLMKNSKNAPLYRVILAGKHPLAAEFFKRISKIEYSGQRTLGW
jgi:three-Cys-motif partner protein